ncbi:MAG: hypothetical protein ABIQ02_08950, partial [Saprospiraceae bacterium]
MKYQCTICPNTSNYTTFKVKEMQLGLREEFLYVLCNDCQCIQIADIPLHLEKYYPGKDYYSFSSIALRNKLYSIYFDIVAAASFSKKGLFFKMVDAYGLYDYSLLAIGRLAPPKDWKILDVGSGNGQLLYQLT